MVKNGEDFVVFDAKTGEDITRSVLAQIIFEQENKEGQSLLPIAFLRQLIRFYGDSMQMLVPRFLEQSMHRSPANRAKFRGRSRKPSALAASERSRSRCGAHEMFEKTFAMFAPPFARASAKPAGDKPQSSGNEMDELKRQLDEMQKRLDKTGRQGINFATAVAARSVPAVHGRSRVASPISAPCRKSQPQPRSNCGGPPRPAPFGDSLETEPASRSISVCTKARSSLDFTTFCHEGASIFTISTPSLRRLRNEVWPAPKSSMAMRQRDPSCG